MSDVHYIDGWPQPYRLMDAQPYWDALEEKQLTYQCCGACNHVVWPAHGFCTQCGAPSLTWQVSSGRGKIYSFSTVVRGPTPTWQAISPYTVGFVEMEEGYFLFTQFQADAKDIAIGKPVEVRFEKRGAQVLPFFVLAKT